MATEPLEGQPPRAAPAGQAGEAELQLLRAEREALRARCAEADARIGELGAELAATRAELARLEQTQPEDGISLFDDPQADQALGLAGDGSDPRVLPLVLTGIAAVTAMVAALAALNGGIASPAALAMLVLTVVLGWCALRTRVVPVEVSVVRGLVYIKQGEDTHRFDLRSDSTKLEMTGEPGDPYWRVRFLRRSLDPFTVDASMVDPHEFTRTLREWRPAL